MILELQRLPASTRGIYGPDKNIMPTRMLLLAPDVAASLLALEAAATASPPNSASSAGLTYSDMFRTGDSSLAAVASGRGAQPPAYSAHNYGVAVDVAVDETLARRGWSYADFLAFMGAHGWYCYRRDEQRGAEDWHFNFLGDDATAILSLLDTTSHTTWPRAAEAVIRKRYGDQLVLDVIGCQRALQKLGMYRGGVDGQQGPLTSQAAAAFARAWSLSVPDLTDPRFQRTLAYIAADLHVAEIPVG